MDIVRFPLTRLAAGWFAGWSSATRVDMEKRANTFFAAMRVVSFVMVSMAGLLSASLSASAQDAPFVSDVFQRINEQRTQHGLDRCTYNKKLEKAAQFHAEWMARNRKMEHLQEEARSLAEHKTCNHHPINRAINAGYVDWERIFFVETRSDGQIAHVRPGANDCVGEIIAAGWKAGHPMTQTQTIVTGWMNSPGHRKEILTGRYKEMGIGVACTPGAEDTFWCVTFGDPEQLAVQRPFSR